MRRHYLSPVIGTGAEGDSYRAQIVDYASKMGLTTAALIPASGPGGPPASPWALVVVGAADHALLLADPDLEQLPAVLLDAPITAEEHGLYGVSLRRFSARLARRTRTASAPAWHRSAMSVDVLEQRGLAAIVPGMLHRTAIRRIGQLLVPEFEGPGRGLRTADVT